MREGTETVNKKVPKHDYQESLEQQIFLNVLDAFNQNLKDRKLEEQYAVKIVINQKHFTKLLGVTQRNDLQVVARLIYQYNDHKRQCVVSEKIFECKVIVGDKESKTIPSKEEVEGAIQYCFKVLTYEAVGWFCMTCKHRKLNTGEHENG